MPSGAFALSNLAAASRTPPLTAVDEPEEHDETGAPDHGEHHDRATLLGAKAHLSSREKHARFRLKATRSRIFGALTLLSAVMLTINIVQIVLLEKIVNSVFLLVGVPAIVFGLMILVLLLWVLPYRTTLLETWQDASSKHIALTIESSILAHTIIESTRSAWIGNCLSILLPIILCEFVYMNSVAVPAFKTKVWSTSLQANDNLTAPSLPDSQFPTTSACDPIVPLWLSAAVSQHDIYLRQTTIADDVRAIVQTNGNCSADIYTHYNQYDVSVETLPMVTGGGPQCDLGLPGYTGPCPASLMVSYSSLLVTTLRSNHGTDWLKMLLEEGSIVGGIMFVTWFFNIFVT
ncbi:hypothetical protein B0A54_14857 [Friedmanniomyces endolithicus]|uniref:Uncharacterized protein n=1 Tax=Friedmanniomyces endolithicus TaxID=329885 RepID=A0A4U0UEM3_9PEZI|nr:hypothetical protein B0A54_14857 [Friedmanniomyces endolithicus]